MSENGTVVYSDNSSSAVAIQVSGDETEVDSVSAYITISNMNAPHEYEFPYELEIGYKLVTADQYIRKYASNIERKNPKKHGIYSGEVYVLDRQNEIVLTIDPAWAKDANGKKVRSFYKIRGNVLIQVVDFSEKTAFPVIADPSNPPDKYTDYYLTKSSVKKERDKYTGSTATVATEGMVNLALCASNPYVGGAFALVSFSSNTYKMQKFNTWDKIYCKFPAKKKYAKIHAKYKYHQGHKAYYPTGKLTATYVKKMS